METKYCIGIDLGTSNSALAIAPADPEAAAEICSIPQLFSLQGVGELEVLPSVLYLPLENEAAGVTAALPWQEGQQTAPIVGQFAREQGALRPDRLVASAKSWLCNPHVNPEEKILPWKAELEAERKVSPFDASVRYLAHLRQACGAALKRRGEPVNALDAAEVVVTVPASFDEVARVLTHQAAQAAGWGEVTLLEEQQAAFYYWSSLTWAPRPSQS